MSGQGETAADCSTTSLPTVQANYTPKGGYEDLEGYKTYISGDKGSKGAVLMIYDIHGIKPQILQGCDLLASQGFCVYMPDLMRGDYITDEMMSGTPEADKMKDAWRARSADANAQKEPVSAIIKVLSGRHSSGVAAAGFCWGYRVLAVCPGSENLKAMAGCHPGGIAPEHGETIKVPLCLLPSKGENMDIIKHIHEGVEKRNPGKNHMKLFGESVHGWMAARANLDDPTDVKYFTEGYETLVDFFKRFVQV